MHGNLLVTYFIKHAAAIKCPGNSCWKSGLRYLLDRSVTIQWITELDSLIIIWWIVLSTGSINHFSVDNGIGFLNTYLVDSAIQRLNNRGLNLPPYLFSVWSDQTAILHFSPIACRCGNFMLIPICTLLTLQNPSSKFWTFNRSTNP